MTDPSPTPPTCPECGKTWIRHRAYVASIHPCANDWHEGEILPMTRRNEAAAAALTPPKDAPSFADDVKEVRDALDEGRFGDPTVTLADSAMDRIVAHAEALEAALREIAAASLDSAPQLRNRARAALTGPGEPERCPTCGNDDPRQRGYVSATYDRGNGPCPDRFHICDRTNCFEPVVTIEVGEAGDLQVCAGHTAQPTPSPEDA